MNDHGHTRLGCLPAEAAEPRKRWITECRQKHVFEPVCIVQGDALEDAIAQTPWKVAQEARIRVLGRAVSSLLRGFKEVLRGGSQAALKAEEILNCFSMVVSYCYGISKAKNISADRHRAGRR